MWSSRSSRTPSHATVAKDKGDVISVLTPLQPSLTSAEDGLTSPAGERGRKKSSSSCLCCCGGGGGGGGSGKRRRADQKKASGADKVMVTVFFCCSFGSPSVYPSVHSFSRTVSQSVCLSVCLTICSFNLVFLSKSSERGTNLDILKYKDIWRYREMET